MLHLIAFKVIEMGVQRGQKAFFKARYEFGLFKAVAARKRCDRVQRHLNGTKVTAPKICTLYVIQRKKTTADFFV